jgi:integrase
MRPRAASWVFVSDVVWMRLLSPAAQLTGIVTLSPVTVEVLQAHKGRQAKAELAAKPGQWFNTLNLVFTTAHGEPLEPSFVTQKFQQECTKAGLPVIRFHDLRHSFVSLLGEHGVDVAVASKMIGHSTVTLTLNTYRHVFEKVQREAANAIDRVLAVE